MSAETKTDLARISAVIQPTKDFTKPEPYERYPGGGTTVFKHINRNSFSHASANIKFERQINFHVGNGFFRRLWVSAPASTKSADGLGPLFNARSCQNCHLKDGRGHTPTGNWPVDDAVSMFLRLSIPPQNKKQLNLIKNHRVLVIREPVYGGQLQDLSIQGHEVEGKMNIEYEEVSVSLSDGEQVSLRIPTYSITDWKYGEPHKDLMISPRIAPPMIGLGLLEAIDEKDILSKSDPFDKNNDGISGKPNQVWDQMEQRVVLGRFGWKAGQPNIHQQSSGAFKGDIGISTPMNAEAWGDCTPLQDLCRSAPNGNSPDQGKREISREAMDKMVFYARNLAVPTRRDINKTNVLLGKKLFYKSGCIGCHTPKFVTKRIPEQPEQSFQLIWPYTDLLLHDMGEGLADHRPEGDANGREWRTPPLWGIGLTETVNGHTEFLHDGRARNLLEAILWHGGEAEFSKQKVVQLNKTDRDALITFLDSL
ncbi:MAG TPA: di-heme oxidoredictase family protein [Candidatus Marinimicrobia bacterium]|nr:di-heme oxidoredictase family protein [Candidatus Neomarinimicrobiota bacterium]